jgi:hypothetical protein
MARADGSGLARTPRAPRVEGASLEGATPSTLPPGRWADPRAYPSSPLIRVTITKDKATPCDNGGGIYRA